MSKGHVHYLGLVMAAKGGVPSLEGPFLTYAEAEAAVQEQIAEDDAVIGGVIPFDLIERAAPEPAPAPEPSEEPPAQPETFGGAPTA